MELNRETATPFSVASNYTEWCSRIKYKKILLLAVRTRLLNFRGQGDLIGRQDSFSPVTRSPRPALFIFLLFQKRKKKKNNSKLMPVPNTVPTKYTCRREFVAIILFNRSLNVLNGKVLQLSSNFIDRIHQTLEYCLGSTC